jgi:hypothetical protein
MTGRSVENCPRFTERELVGQTAFKAFLPNPYAHFLSIQLKILSTIHHHSPLFVRLDDGTRQHLSLPWSATHDGQRGETCTQFPNAPSHVLSKEACSIFFMCIAVFICCLETFIITTALPQITSQLGASDSDFAWIGSAYLLSYAAVIPLWARLSDLFGQKPILTITSTIFLLGTIIGALSRDSAMLIAGRAVQGTGVGGLMVVINICVVDMYPPR